MRVYLDACTIIYAHEGSQDLRDKIAVWLDKAAIGGVVMTSSLSRLECRVKPLRDNDMGLLALYDGFFSRRSLLTLPIDDAVLDHAPRCVLHTGSGRPTPFTWPAPSSRLPTFSSRGMWICSGART